MRGGQRARLVGEHAAVGGALAERFQRRQTLDGIEELRAESFQRAAGARMLARRWISMETAGRDQA